MKKSDLYDFENFKPLSTTFSIKTPGYIVKDKEVIGFSPIATQTSQLCYIDFDNNDNFYLFSSYDTEDNQESMNNIPYIIVNSILYSNAQKVQLQFLFFSRDMN